MLLASMTASNMNLRPQRANQIPPSGTPAGATKDDNCMAVVSQALLVAPPENEFRVARYRKKAMTNMIESLYIQ